MPIGPTAPSSSFPVSKSLLRSASYYLGEIESKYPDIAQAISQFPWLANGITDDERWALDHILAIAEADLGTATSVVDLPLFNGEDRSLHRDFSASVRELLIDEPDLWNQIIDRPWFQDGLTDAEAALIVVLSKVVEHQGDLFLDLIQDSRLRSETVSLPSGQVNLFTVRRASFTQPNDSVFEWLGTGIETIEDFMGPPWVKNDVILYLEPDFPAVSDLFEAGFNAGTHIVIKTDPAEPQFQGTLHHELAHYYFHGRNFPEWFREGAAEFLESYTLHSSENARLRSRYNAAQRNVARYCSPSGVSNVVQWLEPPPDPTGIRLVGEGLRGPHDCHYPLGESFLLGMYDALGHEVVSTSLRELYDSGESSGSPATEDEIYQAFLSNTPSERQDQFRDLYSRLHGGPPPGWRPTGPVPSTPDTAALVALYDSANGQDWNNNRFWMSEVSFRQWYGLNTDPDGRIVKMFLQVNRLTGQLPAEIGSLSNLEHLDLQVNELAGPIPAGLGNLLNLQEFLAASNRLSGAIPPELANLSSLLRLNLSGNELTGPIPPELGNGLVELEDLSLGANRLTGTIPPELAGLSNLSRLSLGHNQLTGAIPSELAALVSLQILDLSANQLTGQIPAELGGPFYRTRIDLSGNQLTGPIPPELADLSFLQELNLADNRLTGPIPPELGDRLVNLRRVFLSGNQLTGCIPPGLRRAEENDFDDLGIPFCQVKLTAEHQGDRAALVALYNATDGANWKRNKNWLSELPIGEWYGVVTDNDHRVVQLRLSENQLTGTVLSELGNLSNLGMLVLSRNRLTGSIPAELGNLSKLETLALSHNRMTGPIPKELGNLSKLEVLGLIGNPASGNRFTGEIPPELGNLSNLQFLALSGNQLAGPIPTELANLSNLSEVNLAKNRLTGGIPPGLSNLSNLETLYLNDNRLSGCIPDGLRHIKLTKFDGNDLAGCVASPTPVPGSPAATELEALVALYDAANGPGWTNNEFWLSVLHPSSWYGVATAGGKVTGLQLPDNGLTGELPTELGNISGLKELDLSGNRLTGRFPAELGELPNLRKLLLGGNSLTGCVPDGLRDVRVNDLDKLGLPFC